MRPAFGDWRSLVAHFVRDEGVGGSNPLSPTNSEKPAYGLAFCCLEFSIVGLISAAPSGRIGHSFSATPDGGADTLSGLRPSIVGLISEAPSGRIGRPLSVTPDGGASALSGLRLSIVGLISAAPSGRIGSPLSAMPDGGAGALSGLRLSIVGLRHQAGSVAHFRQRRMAAQAPYPAYGDFAIGKKCASLLTVCSRFCDIFHCLFLSLLKFFFALLMAEPSIFRCAF